MRIGIDARPLREKQTSGIPRYVKSLLNEMSNLDKKNEYILYAHKYIDFSYPKNFLQRSGALTCYGSVWMQTELPFWLKQDKVDIFWGTQHILPILSDRKIKTVLTMHDLVHLVFPETMKSLNLLINKFIIPPSVKKADAIVTISNWTMLDVKKFLNPQSKILKTAHLGVSPNFFPRIVTSSRAKIRNRFNLKEPFILTVGTFEPRKNILGIFKAFSLIHDKIPHDLVIVGQKGWKNKGILEELGKSNIFHRVHLLGFVEDEWIPELYSAADVFVFPSLYEGFGLPPLEAMACGTPVVASNVSSIPEIVGDAALLVNPHKPEEIAEGIVTIINNPFLRSELIKKGLKQASGFTWNKTAKLMLDTFSQLG